MLAVWFGTVFGECIEGIRSLVVSLYSEFTIQNNSTQIPNISYRKLNQSENRINVDLRFRLSRWLTTEQSECHINDDDSQAHCADIIYIQIDRQVSTIGIREGGKKKSGKTTMAICQYCSVCLSVVCQLYNTLASIIG